MKDSADKGTWVETVDWAVREATPEDVPLINALYATVFGVVRSDAEADWRFFKNPAGKPIIMIAEADGIVVGHRALWPVGVQVGRDHARAAQSVDTMTHPEYRRRGIYLRLAAASLQLAADRGIEVLYGFPNEQSYPASMQKLGWTHIGNVGMFSRPLRNDALRRVPPLLRPLMSIALAGWPRASTRGFGIDIGRPNRDTIISLLTDRTNGRGVCQTTRSPEWYDWRFAPVMQGRYEWVTITDASGVEALAVWGRSIDGREAHLAEVLGHSPTSIAAVIAAVLDRARDAGTAVLGTVTNRPDILRALKINGFRRTGELPFKVRSTSARAFPIDFHDFTRWRILGADFDVY